MAHTIWPGAICAGGEDGVGRDRPPTRHPATCARSSKRLITPSSLRTELRIRIPKCADVTGSPPSLSPHPHRLLRICADGYPARGRLARILNYEFAGLSPEHLSEIMQIRKTIERLMRELVEAGVTSGQFRTVSPRLTSIALLSLTVDVARWYREDRRWTPEEVADHYCELALRIVGADTTPRRQARPASVKSAGPVSKAARPDPGGAVTAPSRPGGTNGAPAGRSQR